MYSKEEKIVMWLSSFEYMSYKKAKFILDNFENLEDFFDNIRSYKNKLISTFESEEINDLCDNNNLVYIDRVIDNYDKLGIDVVTLRSENYPALLKEISSPPIMLYCKGNLDLLNSDCLGVVGTRRATKYGKDFGSKIIKDVASENITIVSGLADGIDTMAHKSCLEVKGKTIAVLAGGLLSIYPSNNIGLAEDIVRNNGLLISEYKPNEQAVTYHFPIRNRIIAGLSKGVFVVEATEKSGSMYTKNYALDYNREVFALPARANDIYSTGCNKIIQNGQAKMVLDSKDIMEFFGKDSKSFNETKVLQLTYEEQMIYDMLVSGELHFDELAKNLKIETKVLSTMLMRLEIKGIIQKLPGNYYSIVN